MMGAEIEREINLAHEFKHKQHYFIDYKALRDLGVRFDFKQFLESNSHEVMSHTS